jgi:hypothetical protein
MVKQYPHYLFSITSGGDSVQDENGSWVAPKPTTSMLSKCREETDGRGTEIQVADGTFHKFTSLIQLPKGAKRVEIGTQVFVAENVDGTVVRIKGTVLKFDAGQLHSRLWV